MVRLRDLKIQYKTSLKAARIYILMYRIVGSMGYLKQARNNAEIAEKLGQRISRLESQRYEVTKTVNLSLVA